MRTTIPADGRCTECRWPVVRCDRGPAPEGFRRYNGGGICKSCQQRHRRHRVQPPGTPRALEIDRQTLVEDTLLLRSDAVPEWRIAERLGMKPFSYKRAIIRAGLNRGRRAA